MTPRTFQAEPPWQALLGAQARLLARPWEHTAHAAPDGHVLATVEARAVPAARERARQAVQATLQAQAEAAEKKGRRQLGPQGAGAPERIVAGHPAGGRSPRASSSRSRAMRPPSRKGTAAGTWARARRLASSAQARGRYSRALSRALPRRAA